VFHAEAIYHRLSWGAHVVIIGKMGCTQVTPCGGRTQYLHRSPASHKRRQKGN
jgi:hypothetical protein